MTVEILCFFEKRNENFKMKNKILFDPDQSAEQTKYSLFKIESSNQDFLNEYCTQLSSIKYSFSNRKLIIFQASFQL